MSPKAVRVRTASGWEDIAIQGPPGPAGRTPSCRAQSGISFAAADTYYRGLGLNFSTVAFDDFGNSFAGGLWTCRQTGRYLIIASFEGLANTGDVGIAVGPKRVSSRVTKGADGNTWGTELSFISDYTAGQQLGAAGYHSGGGAGTFTFEAIRIDAPAMTIPAQPFLATHPGSVARYIASQFVSAPTNDGSGNSQVTVPLGFTWTTHLAFQLVKFWPQGHWGWYMKGGPYIISPSQGGVMINNAPAQNFEVIAISIGIP